MFTPIETLAIANVISSKDKKLAQTSMAPTGVGKKNTIRKTQNVDLIVHITGDMGRAYDTVKDPTVSIPLLPVVALLLHRMGCTRRGAMKHLAEVLPQAIRLDKDARSALLKEVGVADAMADFKKEVIGALPLTPVMGKVAHDLTVTRVAAQPSNAITTTAIALEEGEPISG